MKKILLSLAAFCAFGVANAQENGFKVGIHIGAPMGDAGDVYSLNFGGDVSYMWAMNDQFSIGAATGYSYFSGKDIDSPLGGSVKINGAFIPIAASGQYSITESLFLGADLGYAFYSGDGDGDGGLYYQPKFGYQMEFFEVYAAYKGIAVDGGSVSSVVLGFNYKF